MTIIYYPNQKSPNIIVIMQWKYDIRDQRDELYQIIYERHELKIKNFFRSLRGTSGTDNYRIQSQNFDPTKNLESVSWLPDKLIWIHCFNKTIESRVNWEGNDS